MSIVCNALRPASTFAPLRMVVRFAGRTRGRERRGLAPRAALMTWRCRLALSRRLPYAGGARGEHVPLPLYRQRVPSTSPSGRPLSTSGSTSPRCTGYPAAAMQATAARKWPNTTVGASCAPHRNNPGSTRPSHRARVVDYVRRFNCRDSYQSPMRNHLSFVQTPLRGTS